ncbi:hypothetical protein E4U58_001764 [Claviceps cyperi]|nr:hypothetical protein E4U58_001764 [Claviceps cyperi]
MTIDEICDQSTPREDDREIDPEETMNMDETPIPFDGWDKRQAILVLYIFGDGLQRLKPKIILHGATDSKILEEEGHLYSDEVAIKINPSLCLQQ